MDDFLLKYDLPYKKISNNISKDLYGLNSKLKVQNYEIFFDRSHGNEKQSRISVFNDESYTLISNSRVLNNIELTQRYDLKYLNDSKLMFDLFKIYKRKFVDFIEGPFSVIIIDNKRKKILAYSDHFSSKPIFYSKSDQSIFFSNSISTLRDYLDLNEIDDEILIDYLISGVPRAKRTIFKNINIIPTNTELYFENNFIELKKYQSFKSVLNEDSFIKIKKTVSKLLSSVLAEEFSRSNNKIAFTLSGGLDSSSLVCMGNNIEQFENNNKFSAHSAFFSKLPENTIKKTDESIYIEDVIKKTKILSYKYEFKDESSLSIMDQLVDVDEPALGPNLYINYKILNSLKDKKIETLIEGIGGDSALSHGHGLFYLLGRNLKIFQLFKQYKKYCEKQELYFSYWLCIKNFIIIPRIPIFIHKKKYKKEIHRNDYFNVNNFLKKEFQIDIGKRFEEIHGYHPKLATSFKYNPYFYEELSTNDLFEPYASRVSYHVGRKFNIEIIFPFNDKRIRKYCMGIPYKYKMHYGTDRYYFRKSMHNIIPESVEKRVWKSDISPMFLNEMKKLSANDMQNMILDNNKYFKKLIDKNKLREMCHQFKLTGDQKFATTLYKYIYMSMWLKKNVK